MDKLEDNKHNMRMKEKGDDKDSYKCLNRAKFRFQQCKKHLNLILKMTIEIKSLTNELIDKKKRQTIKEKMNNHCS